MNAASPSPLIFDWKHRSRSRLRLAFFLLLVVAAHGACFYFFGLRTPPPNRTVPVPATIVFASAGSVQESASHLSLAIPTPAAGVEVSGPALAPHYVPSYEGHDIKFDDWPEKSSPFAWPDVSGINDRVLPPPTPSR